MAFARRSLLCKADGLGGGSGEPDQDCAEFEVQDDDEMRGEVEGGENSIADEDMGSMEKNEGDEGKLKSPLAKIEEDIYDFRG